MPLSLDVVPPGCIFAYRALLLIWSCCLRRYSPDVGHEPQCLRDLHSFHFLLQIRLVVFAVRWASFPDRIAVIIFRIVVAKLIHPKWRWTFENSMWVLKKRRKKKLAKIITSTFLSMCTQFAAVPMKTLVCFVPLVSNLHFCLRILYWNCNSYIVTVKGGCVSQISPSLPHQHAARLFCERIPRCSGKVFNYYCARYSCAYVFLKKNSRHFEQTLEVDESETIRNFCKRVSTTPQRVHMHVHNTPKSVLLSYLRRRKMYIRKRDQYGAHRNGRHASQNCTRNQMSQLPRRGVVLKGLAKTVPKKTLIRKRKRKKLWVSFGGWLLFTFFCLQDLAPNHLDIFYLLQDEVYCICGGRSYGKMIACENPDCRMKWFHFACVNLTPSTKPTGKWSIFVLHLFTRKLTFMVYLVRFCPECAKSRCRRAPKPVTSEHKTYKNLIENALRKLAKKKKGRAEVCEIVHERVFHLVVQRHHDLIDRALSEKSAPW